MKKRKGQSSIFSFKQIKDINKGEAETITKKIGLFCFEESRVSSD